jgi:hypothetical protein
VLELRYLRLNFLQYLCSNSYQIPYNAFHKDHVSVLKKFRASKKCGTTKKTTHNASDTSAWKIF